LLSLLWLNLNAQIESTLHQRDPRQAWSDILSGDAILILGWPRAFYFFKFDPQDLMIDVALWIFLIVGSCAAVEQWIRRRGRGASLSLREVFAIAAGVSFYFSEQHLIGHYSTGISDTAAIFDRVHDFFFSIVASGFALAVAASLAGIGRLGIAWKSVAGRKYRVES
jgi:hypothetical protein